VIFALLVLVAPATALPQEEDAFVRGARAFRLGQYELAIFEYRQALSPTDKRYAEAAREFARALQLSKGTFADARYNLSLCQRLQHAQPHALLAELKISQPNASAVGLQNN
jgi:tetratricopeptide (TPR) repeat protein